MFPRRLPWSRIYRAFPELDRFSDEECERFVTQAQVQGKASGWPGFAPIGVGLVFAVLTLVVGYAVLNRLGLRGEPALLVTLILWFLAAGLAFLLTRDALLIRAIRGRIDHARCTNCRHSLLGLPLRGAADHAIASEAVRCPECGSVMLLARLGLVPADLIPREQRRTTEPRPTS